MTVDANGATTMTVQPDDELRIVRDALAEKGNGQPTAANSNGQDNDADEIGADSYVAMLEQLPGFLQYLNTPAMEARAKLADSTEALQDVLLDEAELAFSAASAVAGT